MGARLSAPSPTLPSLLSVALSRLSAHGEAAVKRARTGQRETPRLFKCEDTDAVCGANSPGGMW